MTARRLLAAGGVLAAASLSASAASAGSRARVNVTDNAFVRDSVQRPVVRIRSGSLVTWRWRSQQSHSVVVHSGPQRFATRPRNRGTFTRRFTSPGTYRIVCALHAPGMRMTVVVRRA